MWWRRVVERHAVRQAQRWASGVLFVLALAPGLAHSHAPCSEGLSVAWRFHASAPVISPPATGANAQVVVASYDSYIHALASGGRFLWSYTLDAPAVAVEVDDRGRVYAVSERGQLHVLRRSGAHAWGARLPSPMLPTGPAAFSPVREHLYIPSAHNLYAFSAESGLLWRAFLTSRIQSGPVLDDAGRPWIITRSGDVHRIETPHKRVKFALASHSADTSGATALATSAQLSSVHQSRVVIVEHEGIAVYSATGERVWQRTAVQASTSDGGVVAIGGVWYWVNVETGETEIHHPLDVAVSAQPEQVDEWLYIPTNSGRLYALSREGDVQWCDVATAPLLRPVRQAGTGLVIIAAGDGSVAAVRQRRGPS